MEGLDTIQAAILLAKLDLFEVEVDSRIKIGSRYTSKLKEKGLDTILLLPREYKCLWTIYYSSQ